ncbi:hypothetical protein CB1_000299011 [Camelus ferus]|nr:hypothetical protein CB1_000299011 [Camelus ferus]
MRRVRRFQIAQYKCLVIKYAKDTRYSNNFSTHDRNTMEALPACLLRDVVPEALGVAVIGIDEGQFGMVGRGVSKDPRLQAEVRWEVGAWLSGTLAPQCHPECWFYRTGPGARTEQDLVLSWKAGGVVDHLDRGYAGCVLGGRLGATLCSCATLIDAGGWDCRFPDIVEFSEAMANAGKTVIVAALDGTFQRKAFGTILNLVPLAESVVKLTAVCMECFREAAYTKRLGVEKEVEVIGGADKYHSVCRLCYFKKASSGQPAWLDGTENKENCPVLGRPGEAPGARKLFAPHQILQCGPAN